ncbi:hypothetical protein CLOSTMETH_03012 [[Clostridium] methylpentosum DSM 5476]|uniref:Uncharacterized protein n=1 Tax=[Clostridium] methylpentosum DSM 5476 TaxID=537013 RepID=C0EGL9_9FIRM|nr:hypothetical protein CLOSTMETH_03012 [[Clostridium] methylpentosum DSM 5476]
MGQLPVALQGAPHRIRGVMTTSHLLASCRTGFLPCISSLFFVKPFSLPLGKPGILSSEILQKEVDCFQAIDFF